MIKAILRDKRTGKICALTLKTEKDAKTLSEIAPFGRNIRSRYKVLRYEVIVPDDLKKR